jgi:hypothetical protein
VIVIVIADCLPSRFSRLTTTRTTGDEGSAGRLQAGAGGSHRQPRDEGRGTSQIRARCMIVALIRVCCVLGVAGGGA